jgi:hypothetical protein
MGEALGRRDRSGRPGDLNKYRGRSFARTLGYGSFEQYFFITARFAPIFITLHFPTFATKLTKNRPGRPSATSGPMRRWSAASAALGDGGGRRGRREAWLFRRGLDEHADEATSG